jgi:hypothetical protein
MEITRDTKLPSAFQVGQIVELDFYYSRIKGCEISAVKFTDYGKVYYDVLVPLNEGEQTILKDVDSICVVKGR